MLITVDVFKLFNGLWSVAEGLLNHFLRFYSCKRMKEKGSNEEEACCCNPITPDSKCTRNSHQYELRRGQAPLRSLDSSRGFFLILDKVQHVLSNSMFNCFDNIFTSKYISKMSHQVIFSVMLVVQYTKVYQLYFKMLLISHFHDCLHTFKNALCNNAKKVFLL